MCTCIMLHAGDKEARVPGPSADSAMWIYPRVSVENACNRLVQFTGSV